MIKRLLLLTALGAIAAVSNAQTYPFTGPGRAFSPWTASNPQSWTFAPAYPANAAGTTNNFQVTTNINVDPYVFVGGLWTDTVTVQGMGSGTSSVGTNNIQVLTNMNLSFDFTNFGAVTTTGGSGSATPGTDAISVAYTFQTWGDWSTGTTIDNTGTVAGTQVGSDSTVTVTNSTASPLTAPTLPLPLASTNNGVAGLAINRTVTVTGQLPGDRGYQSTGNVVVTIN